MKSRSVDELGPVDWIVVEFPGSRFRGEIAPALQDLVDRELVRVLDLLVLKKDEDGALEAFELSDLEARGRSVIFGITRPSSRCCSVRMT